ncbi:MAG: Bax inhibitor-1/YccA family protein, partial [Rhodanobacteraceae bacterium]
MPLRTDNSLRSRNPVLSDKVFQNLPATATGGRMTINGTIARAGLMLVLMLIAGWWTWNHFFTAAAAAGANPEAFLAAGTAAVSPFVWGGVIVGLVLVLAGSFKPNWSPITAPLYAIAEGTALGGFSAMFEFQYHGIVLQAVLGSAGVLAVMLALYRTGVIKVTQKLRMGVLMAMGGIFLLYIAQWALSAFSHYDMAFVYGGGGTWGIVFSAVVVCVAAFMLVLDFDLIDRAAAQGAPKYMEWYGA